MLVLSDLMSSKFNYVFNLFIFPGFMVTKHTSNFFMMITHTQIWWSKKRYSLHYSKIACKNGNLPSQIRNHVLNLGTVNNTASQLSIETVLPVILSLIIMIIISLILQCLKTLNMILKYLIYSFYQVLKNFSLKHHPRGLQFLTIPAENIV